jgi:hypothetical protein
MFNYNFSQQTSGVVQTWMSAVSSKGYCAIKFADILSPAQ